MLLVGVLPSALAGCFYLYANSPDGRSSRDVASRVFIPPASDLPTIQKILVEEGVISRDLRFRLLARYLGVSTHLKAGEYIFSADCTPLMVLGDLAAGKTVPRSLTIVEGVTMFQVAQKIAEGGWGTGEEALRLMNDAQFAETLGLKATNLEGYLFPDTYAFERLDSLQHILKTLVGRMRSVLAAECRKMGARPGGIVVDCGKPVGTCGLEAGSGKSAQLYLSMADVLVLASIVEKETGRDNERPLVARVFLNRLQKGMRLQADPTVVYGLQKFGELLSRQDLRTPTPYNTYTQNGLPPGPICNPGRASIAAVFSPADENYYYFVLQADGGHYFSKTLAEHNLAVARLRRHEQASSEK